MADKRFGDGEVPLTDFERELQRRLFGKSQDFPPEFTGWLRLQVEKDPPRLLPTNVDRVYNHPRVRVYHNTTQAVSTGTITTLTLNTELYDPWAMHDTSTNASRLTVSKPGVYSIGASLEWEPNATGVRALYLYLNGSTYLGYSLHDAASAFQTAHTVTVEYALNAGDYVEMRCYQSSGGMLNSTGTGVYGCSLWMTFLADYPPS